MTGWAAQTTKRGNRITRLEKIDHICRSFPTWPEWVQKAALHAIGTHIGPVPVTATIKEALEKMDDDAVDEFYSDVEGNGDLIPDPTKPMEHVSRADCWCQPETNYVDPETGATVYVHREIQ